MRGRKTTGYGRRLLRAALALGCVVVAAAGCGVPGSGEPEPLDNAPGVGGPVGPAGSVRLPEPDPTSTPADLVERFLKTGAAADWDPALPPEQRIQAAIRQAQLFLDPTYPKTWKSSASINVVEVIGDPKATVDNSVSVTLRQVGVLNGTGTLTPAGDPQIQDYLFKFDPKSMLLTDAPVGDMLPLSLKGLSELFRVSPVYYWDLTDRFLVPDRRYISAGISDEKRVKTIVARLLAGPSEFLTQPAAVRVMQIDKPLDNATLNGSNVVVNLPPMQETDLDKFLPRLATQLRWSLHPQRYTVELRIGGRDGRTYSGTDYLRANPSLPVNDRNERRLFGAVDGKLKPIDPEVSPPSILNLPENSYVVAAAVNTRQNSAALVRQVGGGPRQLWVGRTPADRSAATFTHVAGLDGLVGPYSRPSYLPGADRVLIVAAGNLYDVNLGTGEVSPVNLPLPLAGALVAVSVAPDGARIAMVTAGKVYVATIDPSKPPVTINANSAQPLRELYVGNTLGDLRGVAWNFEHQIIVGGRSGLVVTAIDGGSRAPAGPSGLQGAQLTQLSAVSWDPINNLGGGDVVIEVSAPGGRQSYFPYSPVMRAIKAPEVRGASPSASPSGSPSASAPPPDPRVTAAFYADVI